MNKKPELRGLRPLAAAFAAVGMAAVLAGCGQANSQPSGAPPAPPVSVAQVVERNVAETQEFSGRLEAVERVEIRPRVDGFITKVNFRPGAMVKKGDVLFVIDPRPFQAEADRAAAAARSARAKADLARVELARSERLLADRAIAQREFDEKASSVKELDAQARAAEASYEAARLNLAYTNVTAPISGQVSKAEVTAGNLVDGSVMLTSIVSGNPIYASFDGDESTYLRVGKALRSGEKVAVRIGLASEQGFPHEGKLEFVDNRLDPATGSVRMRATLDNGDGLLVPGLFARVQIGGGSGGASRALLVADRAVGTDQDRKFVVVVGPGNKAEYRPVVLGPNVDGLRIVRSGLRAGEQVVVSGLQRVQPGSPVNARQVPMTASAAAPKLAMNGAAAARE